MICGEHKLGMSPRGHDPDMRMARTHPTCGLALTKPEGRLIVRISYVVATIMALAGMPALAQVVVTTPDNGAAAAHQEGAAQDRAAGRQNMQAAHENAAMGNYGIAAQEHAAGKQDFHAARHQEHAARRDSQGGVAVAVP